MQVRPTLTLLVTLAALSGAALAFGPGKDMPMSRHDMRQLHEAVRSGALTDAELTTLKQEHEALRARMQQLRADGELSSADRDAMKKQHQALQDKTRALIANGDKGAPRDTLPEWMQHGKRDDKHGDMRHGGDIRAFRDAVLSGALTDAELQQLQQQREQLLAKAKQDGTRPALETLHQQVKTLMQNDVRGPARDKMPEQWRELFGKPRHHG